MKRAACAFALAASMCGCNSARIAGGSTVASTAELPGVVVASFTPSYCEDAYGAPFVWGPASVMLVRQSSGRFVLVEARPLYDSLVVVNSYVVGDERTFQVALKSTSSAPYLLEYRVPTSGARPGAFTLVTRDWNSHGVGDGFVAWYRAAAVRCVLTAARGGAVATR